MSGWEKRLTLALLVAALALLANAWLIANGSLFGREDSLLPVTQPPPVETGAPAELRRS